MSKFLDDIKAGIYYMPVERRARFEPLKIDKDVTKSDFDPMQIKMDFGVTWNTTAFVNEESKNDIHEILKTVIDECRDAIYGDMRNYVLRLKRAIISGDKDEALMYMREILREAGY